MGVSEVPRVRNMSHTSVWRVWRVSEAMILWFPRSQLRTQCYPQLVTVYVCWGLDKSVTELFPFVPFVVCLSPVGFAGRMTQTLMPEESSQTEQYIIALIVFYREAKGRTRATIRGWPASRWWNTGHSVIVRASLKGTVLKGDWTQDRTRSLVQSPSCPLLSWYLFPAEILTLEVSISPATNTLIPSFHLPQWGL